MLQRAIYILIAIVCLLKIVGYLPIFKIKQWDIRRNIELIIKDNPANKELQRISIPHNQPIKWEREGREFWFNNTLYDIVRFETNDSTTVFYCIADEKETNLYAHYTDFLQKSIKKDADTEGGAFNDFLKKIIKIYFPVVYPPNHYVETGAPKHLKTPTIYRYFYTSFYFNLIDPPPKRVV